MPYVSKNTDGTIWGRWSTRQYEGQEWLPDDHADLLAKTVEQIKADIIAATQVRLDSFARTRGYDGIMSACTYATDSNPKFAAEGQYCVTKRGETWAKVYAMEAEVLAGTRPMPTSFTDVEPELPALEWPV